MKTSTEENQARVDIAYEAKPAPLLLFQPPNGDPALMTPRSSAAQYAGTGWQEHEQNKAEAAQDEMAEGREKITSYFLYGSLMDPLVLRRVLNLAERPRLRPASIVGYHVKNQDVGTISSSDCYRRSCGDSRQRNGV